MLRYGGRGAKRGRRMKTKYITTTYANGYTLWQGYKAIDITASGMIENGLTLTGGRVTVTVDGSVMGAYLGQDATGGAGLTLAGTARLGGAGQIVGGRGGVVSGY